MPEYDNSNKAALWWRGGGYFGSGERRGEKVDVTLAADATGEETKRPIGCLTVQRRDRTGTIVPLWRPKKADSKAWMTGQCDGWFVNVYAADTPKKSDKAPDARVQFKPMQQAASPRPAASNPPPPLPTDDDDLAF